FPRPTKNFTAAHELGHAILHKQPVMHRDIPIDGSIMSKNRSQAERQADKFAAYFLMPAKLVKDVFEELFQTQQFQIDETSAFKLINGNVSGLRKECRNLRGLSKKLASSESYGQNFFNSMATIFNVSVGAMAIRLEE